MKRYAGVVLAGGESKRMGGLDKSGLIVNGASILERTLRLFKETFSEVLIVTCEKRDYSIEGVKVVKDIIKGAGPLGGIYTGLSSMESEAGFFAACDMPFLQGGLIHSLLACFETVSCEAVVPKRGEIIEPLHAVYRKSLARPLGLFLSEHKDDYSIRRFLEETRVHFLDLDDKVEFSDAFKNINSPEDMPKICNPA